MVTNIPPILFIIYANIQHDINIAIIQNIFSTDVIGVISPYPTVVIVAVAQYTDTTYYTYHDSSE
jgi:hypothetical protein